MCFNESIKGGECVRSSPDLLTNAVCRPFSAPFPSFTLLNIWKHSIAPLKYMYWTCIHHIHIFIWRVSISLALKYIKLPSKCEIEPNWQLFVAVKCCFTTVSHVLLTTNEINIGDFFRRVNIML